jgi:hypothetical protein
MKALISPNELNEMNYISEWEIDEEKNYIPTYSVFTGCMRVAEVRKDDEVFDVSKPLFWIDCPDECNPNDYLYKDGEFILRPIDAIMSTDI